MIQVLIGLACLLLLTSARAEADDDIPKIAETALSAVESVKNVNSLCLGYIDGRPSDTARFKQELEKQLTLEGFKVVRDPKTCDATIIGSLQVNVIHRDSLVVLIWHAEALYQAWVYVKLVNANWKTVWEHSFEPHSFPKKPYVFGDGILNRAIDIARGLAKAKQSK